MVMGLWISKSKWDRRWNRCFLNQLLTTHTQFGMRIGKNKPAGQFEVLYIDGRWWKDVSVFQNQKESWASPQLEVPNLCKVYDMTFPGNIPHMPSTMGQYRKIRSPDCATEYLNDDYFKRDYCEICEYGIPNSNAYYSLENMVSRSWSFYDFMTSIVPGRCRVGPQSL